MTRCLRKDPGRRFQHMDDLKVSLEELREESAQAARAPTAAAADAPFARAGPLPCWPPYGASIVSRVVLELPLLAARCRLDPGASHQRAWV